MIEWEWHIASPIWIERIFYSFSSELYKLDFVHLGCLFVFKYTGIQNIDVNFPQMSIKLHFLLVNHLIYSIPIYSNANKRAVLEKCNCCFSLIISGDFLKPVWKEPKTARKSSNFYVGECLNCFWEVGRVSAIAQMRCRSRFLLPEPLYRIHKVHYNRIKQCKEDNPNCIGIVSTFWWIISRWNRNWWWMSIANSELNLHTWKACMT